MADYTGVPPLEEMRRAFLTGEKKISQVVNALVGTSVPSEPPVARVQYATTRELLQELAVRAEEWSNVRRAGAGWLKHRCEDAFDSLEGSPMMEARRGEVPDAR
jgi:hypothetical protein